MQSAIEAYRAFDERRPGWIKVELSPSGTRPEKSSVAAAERRFVEAEAEPDAPLKKPSGGPAEKSDGRTGRSH